MLISTHITKQDVVNALHQDQGIYIETEDGEKYKFVPEEPPITNRLRLSCKGSAYQGDNQYEAQLVLKNIGTPQELAEIDIN